MTIEILMPALSPTMEEGTLSKWLVNEGDSISSGDLIAEIETDKATMEFESFHDGKLIHIGVNLRLLPTTGITLPFISYGGSSTIGMSITCGIILLLSKNRHKNKTLDL